ncbi:Mfa1 family fimbria major subunit [Proteiniphilum sp. UBA5384]|uniref:Mfa1 family fimbria major subunit n=1 Tax=Proteiniphilum sp. UBA5384 TaxID=1947279 RepID=UPI0025EE8E37|nr:Mfa1 family fimbria major subunit [Proteiniphilum sp. UBA5384]
MRKFSKLFLATVVALGMGFTACNSDDVPTAPSSVDGDSWASITVKFPAGATLKASLPGDYNEKGTYTGRDVIETVDVFLVNAGTGTVNYNSFTKSSFESINTDGVLKPNLALTATAGENIKVYAVINGNGDILNTLKGAGAAGFAAAFAGEATKNAADVATFISADKKEKIMMTNDKDDYTINVVSGITKDDAIAGTANHVQVNVDRVVSRAMLTVETAADSKWPVKATIGGTETEIATVTGVTYAVGQSNKKFYIMKKSDYQVPAPVYTYTPGADWATEANTMFDYSGLASFTEVTQYTYEAALTGLPDLLDAEATSKFVLPVNHAVDKTPTEARTSYKKGNTSYMEIRATFVPLKIDGNDYDGEPKTVYLGANDSKFYSTRELAEAEGQQATEYKDGVMKYVIWLNPNSLVATPDEPNPMVSPTVRNQVYHAHINAFTAMGVPNNPLNPGQPGDPDDPDNPEIPGDPDDPNNPKNPIDPEDPLKTDVTYLSVSVKVLPWTMHSYGINLGEDIY